MSLILPVDCDMTFEEYKDQIFRSAEAFQVTKDYEPDKWIKAAVRHYEKSVEDERGRNFETAMLGYFKVIHILRTVNQPKHPTVLDALTHLEEMAPNVRMIYDARMAQVYAEVRERRLEWEKTHQLETALQISNLIKDEERERTNSLAALEVNARRVINANKQEDYRHWLMLEKAAQSEALRKRIHEERAARERRNQELQAETARKAAALAPPPSSTQNTLLRRGDGFVRCEPWVFPQTNPTCARRGLVNLGNTCYMNAILQCLSCVPGLKKWFLQYGNKARTMGPVSNAYAWIVNEMRVAQVKHALSPGHLKNAIAAKEANFSGTQQQDSHEFLRVLLDSIYEEQRVKGTPTLHGLEDTPISRTFGYFESSTLVCPHCNFSSTTYTPSFTLLLPIPTEAKTLYDCLSQYTHREQLPADSTWSCSGCRQAVRASKQLTFASVPNTLIVTLVRFRSMGALANKVTVPIIFPKDLELQGVQYCLVGTVNHQGTISGGHYTADVKSDEDGAWVSISDERVTRVPLQPQWSLAYILYYVAVRPEACGILRDPAESKPPMAPTNAYPPMPPGVVSPVNQPPNRSGVAAMDDPSVLSWINGTTQ